MIFSPQLIKDLGVGVVNGEVITYAQCPHRFKTIQDRGIVRELFKHSNDAIPYFRSLIGPGIYDLQEPYLLKDGEQAVTTQRAKDMAQYLSSTALKNLPWVIPEGLEYKGYRINLPPFMMRHGIFTNVWPVESAWRKGGSLTTSDAGLLKLSDKCFDYPALVLKNEMLMQKYFYNNIILYRLHVVGLDKTVNHPSEQHRVLEFKYGPEIDGMFEQMMDAAIKIYESMKYGGWRKEEKKFRCRFCPVIDCENNYKANPLVYKKKYKYGEGNI